MSSRDGATAFFFNETFCCCLACTTVTQYPESGIINYKPWHANKDQIRVKKDQKLAMDLYSQF